MKIVSTHDTTCIRLFINSYHPPPELPALCILARNFNHLDFHRGQIEHDVGHEVVPHLQQLARGVSYLDLYFGCNKKPPDFTHQAA